MKIIQHFLGNSLRNFNYIVYSESTGQSIFFDPLDLSQTLPLAEKANIKPRYIMKTHNHPDHIRDIDRFLEIPGTQFIELQHGEEFELSATEKVKCIDTPGHVMDHQCFLLIENDKVLGVITGDTVFNAGVGHCKLGGEPQVLFETIRDIFNTMDEDVMVYPSHDFFMTNLKFAKTVDPTNSNIDKYMDRYESEMEKNIYPNTTIGEEKLYNPFFRAFSKKFQSLNNKESNELFLELRAKRDHW